MKSIKVLFCCNVDYKAVLKKVLKPYSVWCDIDIINRNEFDLSLKYDVYFLEVDLLDFSGFEKAKCIQQKYSNALIIFISPAIELSLIGYEYNAFRFLISDKIKEEMPAILNDIKKYYKLSNCYIRVKDKKNQMISLYFRDIIFIISEGNYIDIHTEKDVFRKRCNVKYFREICGYEIFTYVEKGILVNVRYVKIYSPLTGELITKNGIHMNVRKKFKDNFLKDCKRFEVQNVMD